MKLFELNMFKLVLNIKYILCEMYFCLSELLMLHFYKIADNDFIDCILE